MIFTIRHDDCHLNGNGQKTNGILNKTLSFRQVVMFTSQFGTHPKSGTNNFFHLTDKKGQMILQDNYLSLSMFKICGVEVPPPPSSTPFDLRTLYFLCFPIS